MHDTTHICRSHCKLDDPPLEGFFNNLNNLNKGVKQVSTFPDRAGILQCWLSDHAHRVINPSQPAGYKAQESTRGRCSPCSGSCKTTAVRSECTSPRFLRTGARG